MDTQPSPSPLRPLFIVFEGMDRAGKTTQLRELAICLARAYPAIRIKTTRFPNEDYVSGRLCRAYINGTHPPTMFKDAAAVHDMFAQNRREAEAQILLWLSQGYTVLCDRYAFSGVAYSVAKGMLWSDAIKADTDLLAPDVVFVLLGDPAELAKRPGYGADRHDDVALQGRVRQAFEAFAMVDKRLSFLDCVALSPAEMSAAIMRHVQRVCEQSDVATTRGVVWTSHSRMPLEMPKDDKSAKPEVKLTAFD